MPRYYFHVHDGRDIPDEEGIVLPEFEDARAWAVVASAEALRRDLGPRFWAHPNWRMHVVGEQGATVCDLRFSHQPGPH